jgi:hypothetical protein
MKEDKDKTNQRKERRHCKSFKEIESKLKLKVRIEID